jgi:electron transfer flavoprotein beta subunit
MGKQAIDGDNNAVGQMLSALLGWPQATYASAVEVSGGDRQGHPRSRRRPADPGRRPAGRDHRRPAPQRAALCVLPNIMKAKKKPIACKDRRRLRRRHRAAPEGGQGRRAAKRSAGVKVETAADLVSKLKTAGVL